MQQKNRRGLRQNLIFAALVLALAAGLSRLPRLRVQ